MTELTDKEILKNVRELACMAKSERKPGCLVGADELLDILDPPKPDPVGLIKPDDLPEIGTVFEFGGLPNNRKVVYVEKGFLWTSTVNVSGLAQWSFQYWNETFASCVTAVHPPVKQERAKIKLCVNDNAIWMDGYYFSTAIQPNEHNKSHIIQNIKRVLESFKDADGNPRIEVIVK